MQGYQYFQPATVGEAVEILSHYGETARPMAGGTDLVLDVYRRSMPACHIVSLSEIPTLSFIEASDGLRIGATTVFHHINISSTVRQKCQMLAEAAGKIGSRQIRNLATIGGNVCNALPCADSIPSLAALDAELTIAGPQGERRAKLGEFIVAARRIRLCPDELVTEIVIPTLLPRTTSAYKINTVRKALDLTIAGVAAAITLEEDNETILQARIALTNCSPKPLRVTVAEDFLSGQKLTPSVLDEASRLAGSDHKMRASALRASANYRQDMVMALTRRALLEAYQRGHAEMERKGEI